MTLKELLEVFDDCDTTKVTIQDFQGDDVNKENIEYDSDVLCFFFIPKDDELVISTNSGGQE